MSVSSQFEEALLKKNQKDQKVLLTDEPLTEEDCKFLISIPVSATLGQSVLDLSTLTKDIIQGYGIVLKTLESTYHVKSFHHCHFSLLIITHCLAAIFHPLRLCNCTVFLADLNPDMICNLSLFLCK